VTRRDKDLKALENDLRAERTVPSERLERSILDLTDARARAGLQPRMRVAVVGALTAAFLITAGFLGATSYAGSGSSAANVGHDNAADSQYDEKVIICHQGDKPVTLRLSRQGAKAHLREHSGDYAGPCI
jgi:hypothetical protein